MAENISTNSFQWWIGTESERLAYTPVFGTYGIRWWATDTNQLYYYSSSAWIRIGDGAGISEVLPTFMMLPNLRALWAFSSVTEANVVQDYSGQGRTVAPGTTPAFTYSGIIPYADFVRGSSQFLTRASEAGLNTFSNGLTIYTWVWFDAPSTGQTTGVINKYISATNQRAYRIYKVNTNQFNAEISGTGADSFAIGDGVANYASGVWHLLVLRFVPSTSVDLFANNNKYTLAVGIPATIHPTNTSALEFGRTNGAANYLDGRISVSALCAQNHSDALVASVWDKTRVLYGR